MFKLKLYLLCSNTVDTLFSNRTIVGLCVFSFLASHHRSDNLRVIFALPQLRTPTNLRSTRLTVRDSRLWTDLAIYRSRHRFAINSPRSGHECMGPLCADIFRLTKSTVPVSNCSSLVHPALYLQVWRCSNSCLCVPATLNTAIWRCSNNQPPTTPPPHG